jgi:hypothetical protein
MLPGEFAAHSGNTLIHPEDEKAELPLQFSICLFKCLKHNTSGEIILITKYSFPLPLIITDEVAKQERACEKN